MTTLGMTDLQRQIDALAALAGDVRIIRLENVR